MKFMLLTLMNMKRLTICIGQCIIISLRQISDYFPDTLLLFLLYIIYIMFCLYLLYTILVRKISLYK